MSLQSEVLDFLFSNKDEENGDFVAKLVPNIKKESILGVRVPILRSFVKEKFKQLGEDKIVNSSFIKELPHKYHEGNILHSLFVSSCKSIDNVFTMLDNFSPYIDSWDVCDILKPKILEKYPQETIVKIKTLINTKSEFQIRLGIKFIMDFYLKDNYEFSYILYLTEIKSSYYYVDMMISWLLATALINHSRDVLPLIENQKFSKSIIKKTIKKANESYRIPLSLKEHLKCIL